MTNRFTATDKWNDPWFCGLQPTYKLFWLYLCDNCNIAGIWNVNFPLVKFHCGLESVDLKIFGDRIEVVSDEKWFIRKFIYFQQKINDLSELNQENNAHKAIISILTKEGLTRGLVAPYKGLGRTPGNSKGKGNKGVVRGGFIAPGKEEVEAYKQEIGGTLDPDAFIDFYASKGWVVGRVKMKDWRAAYRRANREWTKPNNKPIMDLSGTEAYIEKQLGRIATDDMIQKVLMHVPEKAWWLVDRFLKRKYPDGGGAAFSRVQEKVKKQEVKA